MARPYFPQTRFVSIALCLLVLTKCASALQNQTNTTAAPDGGNQESNIAGLFRLCLENQPDGIVLVRESLDSENSTELLIYFKVNAFWLVPVDKLRTLITGNATNEPYFTTTNQFDATQHFKSYPGQPDYAASFSGLPKGDEFANNIFIFRNQLVHRYRIIQASVDGRISTEQLGSHSFKRWYMFPFISDLEYIINVRNSRMLISTSKYRKAYKALGTAYVFEESNIANPVSYTANVLDVQIDTDKASYDNLHYYYILADETTIVTGWRSGDLCINKNCIALNSAARCDAQINRFKDSVFYWLWRHSAFTIRLLMITFSSMLMINFVVASSFIYHQIIIMIDMT